MLKFILAGGLAIATAPLSAQSGAAGVPSGQTSTVQPASAQVGRPPENSAMRQAGASGNTSSSAQAGAGSTPTNAMTLTLNGGSGAQSQGAALPRNPRATDDGRSGSNAQGGGNPDANSRQGPSYDATGIMRSSGGAGDGSHPSN